MDKTKRQIGKFIFTVGTFRIEKGGKFVDITLGNKESGTGLKMESAIAGSGIALRQKWQSVAHYLGIMRQRRCNNAHVLIAETRHHEATHTVRKIATINNSQPVTTLFK